MLAPNSMHSLRPASQLLSLRASAKGIADDSEVKGMQHPGTGFAPYNVATS